MRPLPLCFLLTTLAACGQEAAPFDAAAATADAAAAWIAGDLVDVSGGAVASMALSGTEIRVWADPWASDAYLTLPEAGPELPEGSAIVREVLDAEGAVDKLTVLVKGPRAAHEALDGWVFGVYDPTGVVMPDELGAPQAGALASCSSCHATRADAQYLFGLPPEE